LGFFAGAAGISKDGEMSEEQKLAIIKEFRLRKGLLVATFCGVMSACFSYGLASGDPIRQATLRHGTPALGPSCGFNAMVSFHIRDSRIANDLIKEQAAGAL